MSRITVKADGIDSCISRLSAIRNNLRPNVSKLLDTVAKDTEEKLNAVYNAGQPADGWWGNSPMTMQSFNGNAQATASSKSDLEKEVVASGESVLFFEYGAGDLTLRENGHYPGEYSEKHAKQYSRFGMWSVGNFTLTGVAPLRPVYYAVEVAKNYIRNHAKEVFK